MQFIVGGIVGGVVVAAIGFLSFLWWLSKCEWG
jgi:hypothetical protein